MKILFFSLIDFDSLEEKGIYTDLLREFTRENHQVYIISPFEKRSRKIQKIIRGDRHEIHKIKIGNIQKTNVIEKGISTLSLNHTMINYVKSNLINIEFDLILYTTPPITLNGFIKFLKNRTGALTYLLLKDIFPQNAVDLDMMKFNGALHRYFRLKEKELYHISDFIGVMSKKNLEYIIQNFPELNDKIEINHNSTDIRRIDYKPLLANDRNKIRLKYDVPVDKKIFIYGGNIGKPQGAEFIKECLLLNENNTDSYILIVGDGTESQNVKNFIKENKLFNSKFLSKLSKEEFQLLVKCCDVGLIFLDHRFTIPNYPSRIITYMEEGLPLLASTDIITDIRDLIEDNQLGYWCESTNPNTFNDLIVNLSNRDTERMGKNSLAYLKEHFSSETSFKTIMKHTEKRRI